MTHVTLIKPRISGNRQQYYINSMTSEPLSIATVAGLLPDNIELKFYDDRLEDIPFDIPTDFVGITLDTYSAKRSYAIASEYRKCGVPVVLGGWHPTLLPDEAEQHADAIVAGEAENVMGELFDDFRNNRMKKRYQSSEPANLELIRPRRDIFLGKPYPKVHSVEFGRGCKYRCDFCSIHKFYKGKYRTRSVQSVLEEIKGLPNKNIAFADDNIVNSPALAKKLFQGLIPLGIRWGSQASIDVAKDEELLSLMKQSGCVGMLIGFESINDASLAFMKKRASKSVYESALHKIRSNGMVVDGSFVWGYDGDTMESFKEDVEFSIKQRFLFAGFNHLMPTPGTDVYQRLKAEGRLLYDKWWLEQEDFFGSVAFKPKNFTADELAYNKFKARRTFYNLPNTLYRLSSKTNAVNFFFMLLTYFSKARLRMVSRKEEAQALPSKIISKKSKFSE